MAEKRAATSAELWAVSMVVWMAASSAGPKAVKMVENWVGKQAASWVGSRA